ncbi:MAG: hypothetical protein KF773_06055 [Deltaproteobacteria bacterium]|nr:hypothetical protein [Deltaproteobacteria bacterium]
MTDHAVPDRQPAVVHDGAQRERLDANVTADRPDEAFVAIDDFIKSGKGVAGDIPTLISRLDVLRKKQLTPRFPELAKRLPGPLVLEVGQALHFQLHFVVDDALRAKPPVTDDALRAFLRSLTTQELVELGDNPPLVKKLRDHLPGPLAFALPQLAELPETIHTVPELVKWYLQTTTPAVAAMQLLRSPSAGLVETVAKLKIWTWIDEIAIGSSPRIGTNLTLFRASAPEDVQTKIDTKVANHRTGAEFEAARPGAHTELKARLATRDAKPHALLDAAARSEWPRDLDSDAVRRLAGESASTILQYAMTTLLEPRLALPLLADKRAPEVVQAVLFTEWAVTDRLAILKDDKLRAAARQGLGRGFPLRSLIHNDEQLTAHVHVIGDEALRHWAYEDKEPATLLWLAVGGEHGFQKSCDLVGRERGFAWVEQLTRTSEEKLLLRLSLNCKDAAAAKHVTENLLHQRALVVDGERNVASPSDGAVHGTGAVAREQLAASSEKIPPHELVSRIADMSPKERHDLLASPPRVAEVIDKLADEDLLERAIFLLAPTIVQLLGMPIGMHPALLSYLRTRSPGEEALALAREDLVRRARRMVPGTSPFLVFPTLRDPAALNAALTHGELLGWLLEGADADLVLTSLSHPVVRDRAAALLEEHAGLYKQLPLYRHLTKQGKASFEQLAAKMEDEDAGARAEYYTADEQARTDAPAARGQVLAEARKKKHLWDAIDELALGGDAASYLAAVRAFPQDHVELLSGNYTTQVRALRDKVRVPPQHVFPAIDVLHLLGLPEGRTWLLASERPYLVLALVGNHPQALKQLGWYLHTERDLAFEFIHALPRGGDLTPMEARAIDELRLGSMDATYLTAFFEIRFGAKLGDGFAMPLEIHRLWNVLARLPPAQVNQEVIAHFRKEKAMSNAGGFWNGTDVVLKQDITGEDQMFERTPLLTAAEVKQYYGLEGAALEQATKRGGWIKQFGDKYQVKKVDHLDRFTSTVLHEVGHSVDTLLGNRTDVVFGAGGWRVYGIDQVEDWAKEMNAFDRIPSGEAKRIADAWKQALRTGNKVSSMVDADHPALDRKYAHSPLVTAAIDDHMFEYKQPLRGVNGRVFTTGSNLGYLCSVPQKTADVAPSVYSMSSPEEFFAECYVEYYRGYDGTPATEANKGGHLPGWIKAWFAQEVDTVRLNPQRVRKGLDGG